MNNIIKLEVDGMGIAFFSPKTMEYVECGSDFLNDEFTNPKQIKEHLKKGDIAAFCTGGGGEYTIHCLEGNPSDDIMNNYPVTAKLVLEVKGGSVQFCDIFWLSDWSLDFPKEQIISLDDGFYNISAFTRMPVSGYWGDNQEIYLYFDKVDKISDFDIQGLPYLYTDD